MCKSILLEEVLALLEKLAKVGALLYDERFFGGFREDFSTHLGRPVVLVAIYLKMMYLKLRYNLGYEIQVKEVI